MPKLTDFAAVIFDMDGLVLDTETTYHKAWQLAADAMGFNLSEEFCSSLSGLSSEDGLAKITNYCGRNFNIAKFRPLSSLYWREWVKVHGIAVKAGFPPLLAHVIDLKLPYCLATNSRTKNALECLAYAGLTDTFPIFISRDDVLHGKPAPDIFFRAAECLEVNMAHCLILEDSYTGVVAASRAGAYVIGVPSETLWAGKMRPYCQFMANNLAEVLESFGVS